MKANVTLPRAELDACYGEDFHGKTFCVLKEKESKQFGDVSWVADVDAINFE